MKISRRQLRRIILEAVSKQLHAKQGELRWDVCRDWELEIIFQWETMIQKLLDSGDEEFFDTGDGKNPRRFRYSMLTRHK